MTAVRPTGSELDRAAKCPASCALPMAKSTSPYAELGTAIHRFLELMQTVDRDEALEAIEDEEHRAACEALELDDMPLHGLATEVTFAFDVETGGARELGRSLGRDYRAARPTEIVLTIDVVGINDEDEDARIAYVADYKSGFGKVIEAKDSWQIKAAAVCVSLVYDVADVVGDVICTPPGRSPWSSRTRFHAFELGLLGAEIAIIRRRVDEAREVIAAGGIPIVSEGEHCKYCPAINYCPAKTSLARQLGDEAAPRGIEELVGYAITPETAAKAWRRLRAVEQLTKVVRDRLERLALAEPIPLGDGRYLGGVTKNGKESINADMAHRRIGELYGPAVAEVAAPSTRKALKKSVHEALRTAKAAGLIRAVAPVERGLLKEFRDGGIITRKASYTTVDEYEAEECRTPGCIAQARSAGGFCRGCELDAEFGGLSLVPEPEPDDLFAPPTNAEIDSDGNGVQLEQALDEAPFGKPLPPAPTEQRPENTNSTAGDEPEWGKD